MRPQLLIILVSTLVTVSLAQSPTLDVAQVGQSLVFTLTGDVADEQWEFSYSTDGGSRWQPIEPSCLGKPQRSRGQLLVYWDALSCIGEFVVADAVFKASNIGCSNPVKFNGYSYDVVRIGEQCWFVDNLRSTRYADGSPIAFARKHESWDQLIGVQSPYDRDYSNVELHGRLYNLRAVRDKGGLCPAGWKVPSSNDWLELSDFLGLTSDYGQALKSLKAIEWGGDNKSGFAAQPSGYVVGPLGEYGGLEYYAYWWCSDFVPQIGVISGSFFVEGKDYLTSFGASVRCLRIERE